MLSPLLSHLQYIYYSKKNIIIFDPSQNIRSNKAFIYIYINITYTYTNFGYYHALKVGITAEHITVY